MGLIISVNCKSCNFQEIVKLGSGMYDMERCITPYYNLSTSAFGSKDINNPQVIDDGDIFYNDPKMFKGSSNSCDHLSWGEIALNAENNFCPKCKKYQLEFESSGHID